MLLKVLTILALTFSFSTAFAATTADLNACFGAVRDLTDDSSSTKFDHRFDRSQPETERRKSYAFYGTLDGDTTRHGLFITSYTDAYFCQFAGLKGGSPAGKTIHQEVRLLGDSVRYELKFNSSGQLSSQVVNGPTARSAPHDVMSCEQSAAGIAKIIDRLREQISTVHDGAADNVKSARKYNHSRMKGYHEGLVKCEAISELADVARTERNKFAGGIEAYDVKASISKATRRKARPIAR